VGRLIRFSQTMGLNHYTALNKKQGGALDSHLSPLRFYTYTDTIEHSHLTLITVMDSTN